MTTETKTFRISKRLSVDITISDMDQFIRCEWAPDLPPRPLKKKELNRYHNARDEMVKRLARRLGRHALIIEV